MSGTCISSSSRPATVDMIDTPPLSLLYSMLPSIVQTRISRLPSLRGSVRGRYSWRISRSRTPPPSYDAVKASMADVDYLVEDTSDDEATLTPPPPSETKTGIDWKFANQGVNLLTLAVEESSRPNPDIDGRTASFGRQLYIHSLTYLIRGLPADLSLEEKASIRSSIPEEITGLISDNGDKQLVPARGGAALPAREPSVLHRVLATGIIQIFIIFQFVLPYIKLFVKNAYLYERNNHISERLLHTSLDTVDSIGRRGVEFGGAVSKMGDGRVGQVINDLASWWVQSIAGGIYEGVGEGMVILGARKNGIRMQD
ncbi:hypothetical protein L228DRAFT_265630 [Xylona heveae TC161]|uniref:Uncharacterized protein n=1 Tax=Xylona heveae (strain CBS 132557 / TC161) TaxID=1328760 RepID=A0A165INL2_XYLHT|nr:hypothetical protein L228DRAFT_265630 [Xylona heveae TC161]KZF25156.1 hypothetical protein L228DRAFT_265630 [Xylona heveae TC161]